MARLTAPVIDDFKLPGVITPTLNGGWFFGTGAVTAGRLQLQRFVAPRSMNITAARIGTTVAASVDDAVHIGIYDSTGARLATSGAVTGKLNAVQGHTIPLTVSLTAGTVYYSAFVVPAIGGTAAQVLTAQFGTIYAQGLLTVNQASPAFPHVLAGTMAGQTDIPATATVATSASTAVAVGLYEG